MELGILDCLPRQRQKPPSPGIPARRARTRALWRILRHVLVFAMAACLSSFAQEGGGGAIVSRPVFSATLAIHDSAIDGVPCLPEGIDSVADLPNITQAMLKRGYSADDVRKILGGNLLRVFAEVEKASRQEQH